MFNLNCFDKRGQTPLHYAVEKQDYEMFEALIQDPFIDANICDQHEFVKPRRLSVIFSAFHKILYRMEKFSMRKKFNEDIVREYTDYESNKGYLEVFKS